MQCPSCVSFCSEISAALQAFGRVTFNTLLPPLANRGDAAHTLHQLLCEDRSQHSTLGKIEAN